MNTGSLIIGRSTQRSKEFIVRVALGCTTRRLFQQLTVEILTIFLLGGVVGLLLAFGLLRVFSAWSPFGVLPPGGFSLDGTVLAATAAIVLFTALLFGSLPALRGLAVYAQDVINTSSPRSTSKGQLRWRNILVAMEISLSVVLLVGAGLLISTFLKIGFEPLGFQTRDVFVSDVALPPTVYPTKADQIRFCDNLLQRLRELPGVRAAGAASSWPFNVDGLTPLETQTRQGLPLEQLPQAATFVVSPGYFQALGIPLLVGRDFSGHDRSDSQRVAVIDDQMARQYFPGQAAVGKRIRLRYIDQQSPTEPWLTIVGVVGDTQSIRYNHIEWDRYPAVYTPLFQGSAEFSAAPFEAQPIFLYLQGTQQLSASSIHSVVHQLDPDLPLGALQTTSEIVSRLRSQPRVRATLLGSLGILTLLLAAIGVTGVMGQMVAQYRKDIGIRMALGAQASDVRRLVLANALRLTVAGITIGSACAAAVARLLRGFLFGISAADPITFVAVVALLLVVALLAAYIPARRASRLEPLTVLRCE